MTSHTSKLTYIHNQHFLYKYYVTNHPQLKRSTGVTRGVTHKRVCILDSTRVYTHTQYYTRVYVCMATVAIAGF